MLQDGYGSRMHMLEGESGGERECKIQDTFSRAIQRARSLKSDVCVICFERRQLKEELN